MARARLSEVPVVVLGGPRSVGKSTLLRSLAKGFGHAVLDLDDPATQRAVATDPTRFLDAPRPVFVDEYARVPELMDVVKMLLNRDGAAGQFVLAGSTRYVEVKAAPDVRTEDTRGLAALARRLGRDQVTGVVMHTGRHGWRIDAHTFAVPIARLWTPG